MRELCPITTPGTPEKVNPSTLNGQVQCSPIWYQIPGIDGLRCGSLASSGLPVVVSAPPITHELDPMPVPPLPSSEGSRPTAPATAASAGAASRHIDAGARSPVPMLV